MNHNSIPHKLKEDPRWVCWQFLERQGKATKVPYQPSGRPARTNAPATWHSFEECARALESGRFAGLGVVLGNGLAGIDFDWKGYTGEGIPPEVQKILKRFKSYAELSPSGKGAHILLLGRLPAGARNRARLAQGVDLEVYSSGRFFTVTGRRINNHDIVHQQAELEALLRDLGMLAPAPLAPAPQAVSLDDAELLERMFSSRSGADIKHLWRGDWHAYPSQSEADLALASHLLWWCNGDTARADALFRRSGLYRPKWDERHRSSGETYGQATLERARASLNGGYEPPHKFVEAPPVGPHDWPAPEPISSLGGPPLREFPQKVILPPELEDYAVALADRLRIPLGLVAMAQLTAASAVVGGKAFIAPDRDNASWVEPSNLWMVGVAEVSSKKTPVLNAVLRPLYELDRELREEYQRELEEYEQELEEWKSAKRGERGAKPKKPAQTRLLAADITKEALAELLAASPAILSYQDELSALFRIWKREDRAAERSFYLSAYSGTPLVVDRISRQATHLERPVLALLGFAQPGVFAEEIIEAVRDGGGADGLLQRFLPVWGELLPWVDERPKIPHRLGERYTTAIVALYGTTRAWPEPKILSFTDEAQKLWYEWEAQVEGDIRNPDHPPAWRGYLGKRLGLTARLALTLGLLHGEIERLSLSTLRRAIAVVLWAEPHAKRTWARALSGDPRPALRLAHKLQAGELEHFTLRELYRNNVAGIATAEQARKAVEVLAEAGWVGRDPRNFHRWVVNPRCREVGWLNLHTYHTPPDNPTLG